MGHTVHECTHIFERGDIFPSVPPLLDQMNHITSTTLTTDLVKAIDVQVRELGYPSRSAYIQDAVIARLEIPYVILVAIYTGRQHNLIALQARLPRAHSHCILPLAPRYSIMVSTFCVPSLEEEATRDLLSAHNPILLSPLSPLLEADCPDPDPIPIPPPELVVEHP